MYINHSTAQGLTCKKKKKILFLIFFLNFQKQRSASWMEKKIYPMLYGFWLGLVVLFFFFNCYIGRTGAEMWNPSEEFSRVEQTSSDIPLKWSGLYAGNLQSGDYRLISTVDVFKTKKKYTVTLRKNKLKYELQKNPAISSLGLINDFSI